MQQQKGAKHQPVMGGGEGASDGGREGAAEEVGTGIRTETKDNGSRLVGTESSGHVQQARAEGASVKELVSHEGFRDATRVRANVRAQELMAGGLNKAETAGGTLSEYIGGGNAGADPHRPLLVGMEGYP